MPLCGLWSLYSFELVKPELTIRFPSPYVLCLQWGHLNQTKWSEKIFLAKVIRWQWNVVEADTSRKGIHEQGTACRRPCRHELAQGDLGISNWPIWRESALSLFPHRYIMVLVRKWSSFPFWSYSVHLLENISFLGAHMLCVIVPRKNLGTPC